jgi:hypothetical protein
MGLEYRRARGAEEILDSVIAATRNHPAWYFKECIKSFKMLKEEELFVPCWLYHYHYIDLGSECSSKMEL